MAEQAMPAFGRPIGMQDAASIIQELMHLDALPLVIESLALEMSPRQGGENDEHARALAESEERLPPIVVHGPSMRVIDGIHRVRAAIIRGEETIPGRVYHGTDEKALVLAVGMNIAHGLPLARADRTAAAVRITHSYPSGQTG